MELREVRFLVQWRNSLRKLCKIAFSSKDASLYLFPYALKGKYHYGKKTLQAQQEYLTFNFKKDIFDDQTPKLSIHESGQVHVFMGEKKAGPLYIPPLDTLRGEHITTVSPDAFENLPLFEGKFKKEGSSIDNIIYVPDEAINDRLALYVNGFEPSFMCSDCPNTFTITRPTISRPLYLGIKPLGQRKICVDTTKGVTIIAGWNPLTLSDESVDFLFIRGE